MKTRSNVIPFPTLHPPSTYNGPPASVHVLRPKPSADNMWKALEFYRQADKLDEDPATFSTAERLYRKAIAWDPLLSGAYANLGVLRFRRRAKPSEVLHWLRRAVELDPALPEAIYNVGVVLIMAKQYDEAIPHFAKALELDGSFAEAHFNLAFCLESMGVTGEQHWRRYLELQPNGEFVKQARRRLLPKNTRKGKGA